MKTTLPELSEIKQHELKALKEILLEFYPDLVMIILFGSYARGDWVEEKADDGVHFEYQSDYDIFVVTETTQQTRRIEANLRSLENTLRRVVKTPISLIAHSIEYFNNRLSEGQYFFLDVKREGICLYDDQRFTLVKARKLNPQDRKHLAQGDFEYWFESAQEFMVDFKHAFKRKSYNNAAFYLHQATERLYTAVLLVFTRYKPKTHDISKFSQLVCGLAPQFLIIFPTGSEEEKHRFELLKSAYIGARYKKTYCITRQELLLLEKQVKLLRTLTEKQCAEKIASFTPAKNLIVKKPSSLSVLVAKIRRLWA